MATVGTSYNSRNVSTSSHIGLSAPRRLMPVGTCIHTTFGFSSQTWLQFGSLAAGKPASCDWLINRDGSRLQITNEGRAAYHAGISGYLIRGSYKTGNELSQLLLGVELENGPDEHCTAAQLDSLADLIVWRGIAYRWQWPYYVVGHYQIAKPMGRRSDPHGFDWGDFMGRLLYWARVGRVAGINDNGATTNDK